MAVKSHIRFDRLITIQTTTESQDAYGDLTDSWSTLAQAWAYIEDQAGSEKYSAAKETAFGRTVFVIRHRIDVTEKMRISHDSKIYDIISIQEETRRRYLRIITELRE